MWIFGRNILSKPLITEFDYSGRLGLSPRGTHPLAHCTSDNTPQFTIATGGRRVPCKITKVVDGDTVHAAVLVETKPYIFPIRLLGINAPELHPKSGSAAPGEAAKLCLAELLRGHEACFIDITGREKYGRWLGNIYVSADATQSVNDMMYNLKQAVKYDGTGPR